MDEYSSFTLYFREIHVLFMTLLIDGDFFDTSDTCKNRGLRVVILEIRATDGVG